MAQTSEIEQLGNDADAGAGKTFVFVFNNSRADTTINNAEIVIDTTPSEGAPCALYYERASNQVFLANDDLSSWSPNELGLRRFESNTQCAIDVGLSRATLSQNQITLALKLNFSASFVTSDAKNIFVRVGYKNGNVSEWRLIGTYRVTAGVVVLSSHLPPTISRRPVDSRPWTGDLWTSTWAADDSLFFSWGDGTGQGQCITTATGVSPLPQLRTQGGAGGTFSLSSECTPTGDGYDCSGPANLCHLIECRPDRSYPLCQLTRAGLRRESGPVSQLTPCATTVRGQPALRQDSCIVDRDLPDHNILSDKKISSLLILDDKLYAHVHAPCCSNVQRGYLIASGSKGWTVVGGDTQASPWGPGSHFRDGMFIQMGQNFSLSPDGYVYLLGIDNEILTPAPKNSAVYLARVRKERIADPSYAGWEYFSSQGGTPRFVLAQAQATPVLGDLGLTDNPGGGTAAQGSSLYHGGLRKYLFLTGIADPKDSATTDTMTGALYWADQPWGPWMRIRTFSGEENRGSISGLIAKDAGPNCVYFSYAGLPSAKVFSYTFHVDAITFGTSCRRPADCGCGSVCNQGYCEAPSPKAPVVPLK